MTTINSTASDLNRLEVCRVPDGDIMLSIRVGSAIYVRETELLDALGAKSQDRWDEAHRSAKAERDEWKARAEKAEAALSRITARVEASPSAWIKRQFRECLNGRKAVILTATIDGIKVGNVAFVNGTLVGLPIADADRLISAGIAKESS